MRRRPEYERGPRTAGHLPTAASTCDREIRWSILGERQWSTPSMGHTDLPYTNKRFGPTQTVYPEIHSAPALHIDTSSHGYFSDAATPTEGYNAIRNTGEGYCTRKHATKIRNIYDLLAAPSEPSSGRVSGSKARAASSTQTGCSVNA